MRHVLIAFMVLIGLSRLALSSRADRQGAGDGRKSCDARNPVPLIP
jgi:hypothetical protein